MEEQYPTFAGRRTDAEANLSSAGIIDLTLEECIESMEERWMDNQPQVNGRDGRLTLRENDRSFIAELKDGDVILRRYTISCGNADHDQVGNELKNLCSMTA